MSLLTTPSPATPRPQLWLDSPVDGTILTQGTVSVVGHAADGNGLEALTLVVDGESVATQPVHSRYDRLASAEFSWTASTGTHRLELIAGGLSSGPTLVKVGDRNASVAPPMPRATTTPAPTASPSRPTASATTSRPTTSQPTPTPRPAPTSAAPQPKKPTLGPISINPATVGPSFDTCNGIITVSATATGAATGSAMVTGPRLTHPIGGSVHNGVFTATFGQRDLFGANTSGTFQVQVTVTNAAGSTTDSASFAVYCSKD